MNQINLLNKNYMRTFILITCMALTFSVSAFAASRDYYQIQVFRLNGKVQEAKVDNFLKNAYLPALHRAGIAK